MVRPRKLLSLLFCFEGKLREHSCHHENSALDSINDVSGRVDRVAHDVGGAAQAPLLQLFRGLLADVRARAHRPDQAEHAVLRARTERDYPQEDVRVHGRVRQEHAG